MVAVAPLVSPQQPIRRFRQRGAAGLKGTNA